MRGTLLDNEETRRKGIYEMKAAKAIRQYKHKHAAERKKTNGHHGGGLFSFLRLDLKNRRPQNRRSGSSRTLVRRETTVRHPKGNEVVLHVSHRTRSPHRRHETKVEGRITQSKSMPAMRDKGQSIQRRGTTGGERPSMPRRATTQGRRDGRSDSSKHVRRR
jgi:hypothetical protein